MKRLLFLGFGIFLAWTASAQIVYNSAKVTVAAGTHVRILSGVRQENTGSFTNNGTSVSITGGWEGRNTSNLQNNAPMTIGGLFTQRDGSTLLNTNTLAIGGGFNQQNTATVTNNASSTINVTGNYVQQAVGNSTTNNGTITVSGNMTNTAATLTNNATGSITISGSVLHESNALFNNSGFLRTILTWTNDASRIQNNATGFLTVQGNVVHEFKSQIANSGKMRVFGNLSSDFSTITNQATGELVVQSAFSQVSDALAFNSGNWLVQTTLLNDASKLENHTASFLTVLGNATHQFGARTLNRGAIATANWTGNLNAFLTNTGSLQVTGSMTMENGSHTQNTGTVFISTNWTGTNVQLNNTGTVTVGNNVTQEAGSRTNNNGTITVGNRWLNDAAFMTNTQFISTGGNFVHDNSQAQNSGSLAIRGNAVFDAASLNNTGFLTVQGTFTNTASTVTNAQLITVGSHFTNNAGSTIQNNGKVQIKGNFTHHAALTNMITAFMTVAGNFVKQAGSTTLNNGSIFVSVNWTNNSAHNALSGTGKVQMYGEGTGLINGTFNTNFYDLELNRRFLTVTTNSHIQNNLNFVSGMVHFQTVNFLTSTGTVTNERSGHYATGKISTTRNIAIFENFGGLGVSLDPLGQNLGEITMIRHAGMGVSENHLDKSSINRTWEFITSNATAFTTANPFLTVNLSFSWLADDNHTAELWESHIWHKPPHKNGAWIGLTMPADLTFRTASSAAIYSLKHDKFVPSASLTKYTVGGAGFIKITGQITEIGYALHFASVVAFSSVVSNGNFGMTTATGFYTVVVRSGFQGNMIPNKIDAVGDPYYFTSVGLPFVSVFEDSDPHNFTAMGKYFVKGRILEIDRAMENVQVSVGHHTYFTTVTDRNGDYTAFISSGFTKNVYAEQIPYFFTAYQVVPSAPDHATKIVNNIQHHLYTNFYGYRNYLITGRVTEANEGLSGVFITTNIGFTTISDKNGFYIAFASSGYTGFISAIKPNYTFEPIAHEYNKILERHIDKDYKASRFYAIEGRITEGGLPFPDATVSLDNRFTTVSDKNGFYTAFVTSGYTGKIQATKTGFAFDPAFVRFEKVLEGKKGIDFQAFKLYGIGGRVLKDGLGFASANIQTSFGDIFQTDSNGFYTAFVSSGASGTLTASKLGHYFEPPSLKFNSVIGFQTVPNFIAFGLQSIFGKIELDGKPLKGVKVISSQGDIYETNENGFYTAFVSANGSTTLTFEKEHHIFEPKNLDFTSVTGETTSSLSLKARLVEYPIFGQLLLNKTTPLANVKIQSAAFTTVSNANGFYTVFQKAGFAGKIQPDSTLDYFDPPFISVQNVFSTVNKINFEAKTADLSLKSEGFEIVKDGKTVYCSKVELSVNLEKILFEDRQKTTYLWSDASKNPILMTEKGGLYFVTVKVPKFYPTSLEKQVEMDINRLTVAWGKDTIICIGSQMKLSADPKATTRTWAKKNGTNYQNLTNSTATEQTVGEGIYRLQMGNGTCEVSYEINIKYTQEQQFASAIKPLYYFCNDQEPIVVDAQNAASVKYVWTGENGFSSDKAKVELVKGGKYKLVVTDKYDCVKETNLELNDTERLENIFVFQSEVREGDTVVFVNISYEKEGSKTAPKTAIWDFGGLAKAQNLDYAEQIFSKEGNYDIKLTVSNEQCQTTRTKPLKVVKMPQGGRAEKVFPVEYLAKVSAELYPNPAQDYVKIRMNDFILKTADLTVYDGLGKEIVRKENLSTKDEQRIDCSKWASGVYLVRLVSGKVVKGLRFRKE